MKKTFALSVPLTKAEDTLNFLRKNGLVDQKLKPHRTNQVLIIPLNRNPTETEGLAITGFCKSANGLSWEFEEIKERPRNLAEAVTGKVPTHLISCLPHSYDIIGDIAVIELLEPVEEFASVIGLAIMEINPHVRLVTRKLSDVAGTYRTRSMEIVAGTGSMETTHHEFSCRYMLNLETVYFNPRLSTERLRVARQVGDHERVVDMFAGVGPFSILIAKMHPNVKVRANDINPAAIKYLNENILMNRVADRVASICGDARGLIEKGLQGWASRVIMNLPGDSAQYLPVAVALLKHPGTLHHYTFVPRNESLEEVKISMRSIIEGAERSIQTFSFAGDIREISSSKVHVAIDAVIE